MSKVPAVAAPRVWMNFLRSMSEERSAPPADLNELNHFSGFSLRGW
jgi:hypothetical protein